MIPTEEIEPHLEELEGYSLKLFEFLAANCKKEICQLSQIEFNCLFRVYSDKINYICDTFDIPEENLSEYLINNETIDQAANENPEMDEAVDVFMDYINGFMLSIDSYLPRDAN